MLLPVWSLCFLGAPTHLYNQSCPLVCWSVGWSRKPLTIHPAHPLAYLALFFIPSAFSAPFKNTSLTQLHKQLLTAPAHLFPSRPPCVRFQFSSFVFMLPLFFSFSFVRMDFKRRCTFQFWLFLMCCSVFFYEEINVIIVICLKETKQKVPHNCRLVSHYNLHILDLYTKQDIFLLKRSKLHC